MSNVYEAPTASLLGDIAEEFYQPRIFSFSGRIGRLRYLGYCFIASLLGYILIIPGAALMAGGSENAVAQGVAGLLMAIAYIGMMVMTWGYMVRRLNDLNKNGWLSLLILVPLANLALALYLIFAAGSPGPNQYGPAPAANPRGMLLLALVFPAIMLIGIFAAIAVPAYQDYVNRAAEAQQTLQVP